MNPYHPPPWLYTGPEKDGPKADGGRYGMESRFREVRIAIQPGRPFSKKTG
jgi:hypothetical protein